MRFTDFRKWQRKLAAATRYEEVARLRRLPLDPNAVVYEAFAGSGMLDNPEAIFDRLRRDPEFGHLTHYWVIEDAALRRKLRREWRGDKAVHFVPRRGLRYWKALATAGYLVNNATFRPEFSKRPGQFYLNTWHGTPLKRMGYDMPDGPREAANTLRNFLHADWLLSQNEFMTDTMYRKAYLLDGVFDGEILEEGYPRTDRQHLDDRERAAARNLLVARGLAIQDRPILLYAPTWKGARFSEVLDDVATLVGTVRQLQAKLGDRYAVLLKTHQSVFDYARKEPHLAAMLVPNDIPTNTILGITDLLVTDYSSIQFDYLATRRPIAYYVPDLGSYADTRGNYLPLESWPGPKSQTVNDLANDVEALSHAPHDVWSPRREEWALRYTPRDDGGAAQRVVDVVFRGGAARRSACSVAPQRRPRVLFYIGGLRSNGITSAAITLVNALAASDDLDVSVVYGRPRGADRTANAARISTNVRQFVRHGGMNATRLEHRRRRNGALAQESVWNDEWKRIFGSATFDTVVDFSGYSPFWARLLLASPPARRLIWLHNDLARDAHRTVRGRKHLHEGLNNTFALYDEFDQLVSVSGELARINRSALAGYASPEKFTHVPNLIDASAMRAQAAISLEEEYERAVSLEQPTLASAIERLQAEQSHRWFVTVGRLSPEKNHARLVRAFARVHATHPDARLLIVGNGPLRDELLALVQQLALDGAVVFSGATRNPAALLAHASCFVLSSDYEGMPMVILEAAALGLPIITTRFGSVADALPDVSLRVAEQTDESLADAMSEYLSGSIPPTAFDAERHNSITLQAARSLLFPQLDVPDRSTSSLPDHR
jgi:CDP-glycerol glycerophosphotransferase (TagB/SpsB family)/glycosyltransferase involved in cell wall biosynthesis